MNCSSVSIRNPQSSLIDQPSSPRTRRTSRLASQKGQGLIEYLVIVALMGVATIAIVRVMGQTVASRFASATHALQGRKVSAEMATIEDSHYKKKDLGDFFNGVGDARGGRGSSQ